MSTNIHASCVKYSDYGIIFVGKSGVGKSDMCLRFILEHQAQLVSDDRTNIRYESGCLVASAPQNLQGLLEVRGLGIKRVPSIAKQRLHLVVELVKKSSLVERMPQPEFWNIDGVKVPYIRLCAFEASAPDKVIAALKWQTY